MLAALCLVLLLGSTGLAAGNITRRLGLQLEHEPLPTAIAWGTVAVAWPLAVALTVATVAMLSGAPLVRLPIVTGLSVIAALALHGWKTYPLPPLGRSFNVAWHSVPARGMLVLALPVLTLHAFLIVEACLRPPMSFDGLFYHLPMIVRWLREGRLLMMPDVFHFCGPGNGELWQFMFATVGTDRLIELTMFPIGVLLGIVVAGLARELGTGRRAALACALMALASPMIALQMYGSYVDLFGTTFLLGSFYWVLRLLGRRPRSRTAAGLAGLSLGVAIGTKLTLVPWAMPVLVAFVVAAYLRSYADPSQRLRKFRSLVWPFVASLPICSLFWYLRNTLETGWPLYPVKLHLFNRDFGVGRVASKICTDLADSGWSSLTYPWIEWKSSGYPYSQDNGLGPMFAAFAVIGLANLVFRTFRNRCRSHLSGVFVIVFVAAGVLLFVEVCFSYARYALPLWLIMFAATGPALSLLMRKHPRASMTLLATTITLSAAMIALWPSKLLAGRVLDHQMGRAATYEIPELFNHLPTGTVVLNMSIGSANYPLLGEHWTNEVIESVQTPKLGLTRPLTRAKLNEHRVEIVFARPGDHPEHLFASDVGYARIDKGTYRIIGP